MDGMLSDVDCEIVGKQSETRYATVIWKVWVRRLSPFDACGRNLKLLI